MRAAHLLWVTPRRSAGKALHAAHRQKSRQLLARRCTHPGCMQLALDLVRQARSSPKRAGRPRAVRQCPRGTSRPRTGAHCEGRPPQCCARGTCSSTQSAIARPASVPVQAQGDPMRASARRRRSSPSTCPSANASACAPHAGVRRQPARSSDHLAARTTAVASAPGVGREKSRCHTTARPCPRTQHPTVSTRMHRSPRQDQVRSTAPTFDSPGALRN
eukprot:COSAG02_NODE_56_length_43700_cov_33.650765_20_plen_218_part_00